MNRTKATGASGEILLQDNTNAETKNVDVYIRGPATIGYFDPVLLDSHGHPLFVSIPQISWKYTVNSVESSLQAYTWIHTTNFQHLATIPVGFALTFSFHLEDTQTTALGGPTDLTINLLSGQTLKTISIKDDGVWKRAIPFVKDAGVWKPATAMVMLNSEWKEAT